MKIGIIGCGVMGEAFAKRLKDHQLLFFDAFKEKSTSLAEKVGGEVSSSLKEMAEKAEALILAVKPGDLPNVAEEISPNWKKGYVLSILAGVTLKTLKELFAEGRVVRLMPNLPLLYGKGVIGLATDEDAEPVLEMLEGLGHLISMEEEKLDALTAVTGSGPAFFLVMVEAMVDSAVYLGFAYEEARELVIEMVEGSLELLKQSGEHTSKLKNQISSPGGTTIAGLKAMEEKGVRTAIGSAFEAAWKRAQEMG